MAINLRRWLEQLATLFDSPTVREINKRPVVSDDDFHREYFLDTDITVDTCRRVRRVLCKQLQLCNTRPTDNVATLAPDIGFDDVCFEIGEEFEVSFPSDTIVKMDGTVDSLIRETQQLVNASRLR